MIDLLVDGRSGQLLGDDAAERQKHSLAAGLWKGWPEVNEREARARLQRARGGTGRDEMCRMMTLRVELGPCEAGSNPPASGAPELRLWGAVQRIDKAELRVRSVCFFCNNHKGANLAGIDPKTRKVVALFNPRRHKWRRHFRWDGPVLVGITPTGRATVIVLEINLDYRVGLRQSLIDEGVFPPG